MEPTLGLMGGGSGGGGGGGGGMMANEAELELGLGLSLGSSVGKIKKTGGWGECGRILTAKDFPNGFPSGNGRANAATSAVSGTKRAADSYVGSPPSGVR